MSQSNRKRKQIAIIGAADLPGKTMVEPGVMPREENLQGLCILFPFYPAMATLSPCRQGGILIVLFIPGTLFSEACKKLAMIFATPNHIPAFELDKLRFLLALLKERKQEFEAFAEKINNKWLRRTVLNLAQECNQYAHEIWGQLETMTGLADSYGETPVFRDNSMLPAEGDILFSCQISEKKLIIAYRNIVNEPVLDDNLRNLLRNQLNGLTCAFMQVKLLNASLK